MSELLEQLKHERLAAMKRKDQFKRDTLATLIGDLQTQQKNQNEQLTDAAVVQALKKALDNAEQNYQHTGDDMFKNEAAIYKMYLPEQMDQQQLTNVIKQIIEQSDQPSIGVVMKQLKADYDGQFDGKTASAIAKQLLG